VHSGAVKHAVPSQSKSLVSFFIPALEIVKSLNLASKL
jgi:hypothetical protein